MRYLPERRKIGPFPISDRPYPSFVKAWVTALSFLLFPLIVFPAHASDTPTTFDPSSVTWKLYLNKDNTKIYQAAPLASGLVPLKASTVFNHPLKRVYNVLYDNNRKTEWVPRLKESQMVKKFHPGRYITYSRYNSPWPFKDRSALVNTVDHYDPGAGIVQSIITAMEYSGLPPKSDEVRIYTKGFFTLKEMDGGKKCSGEIVLINDFKGNIPIWLLNFIQKSWPLKMFTSLKKQLKKDDIKMLPDLVIHTNRQKN